MRLGWLFLTGVCTASGIWATHFVAMLAYKAGAQTAYDPVLTAGSLLVAIGATTLGYFVCSGRSRPEIAIGGAIVGLGIGLMHFTGMRALIVAGTIKWDPTLHGAHWKSICARLSHISQPSNPTSPVVRHQVLRLRQDTTVRAPAYLSQSDDLWGCGAPTPLLFAVATVLHAAPLPAMTFARIDEVDTAVRRSTLSDPLAVDIDEKVLDRQRAGVQRNLGANRLGPTVHRQPRCDGQDQGPR